MRYLPEDFHLVLAGPSAKEEAKGLGVEAKDVLRNIWLAIKNLGLENRVTILDDFVDASKLIAMSDIYSLPCEQEGLGTTMLEAMSCGVPVVANQSEEAFRQWIDSDINGFLCDPEPKLWAETILRVSRVELSPQSIRDSIRGKVESDTIHKTYLELFLHD